MIAISKERYKKLNEKWFHVYLLRFPGCRSVFGSESFMSSGLANINNNCYMNSVIQCLVNLEHIIEQFLNCKRFAELIKESEFVLFKRFLDIISLLNLYNRENNYLSKKEKENVYKSFMSEFFFQSDLLFEPNLQCDAHEFLLWIIENLQNNYNQLETILKYNDENFQVQNSSFKKSFSCKFRQIINCRYGHKSVKEIDEISLSLSISKATCLSDSLENYFSTEYLNDNTYLYQCDICSSNVNAIKDLKILELNKVVIFHLKRFEVIFFDNIFLFF